MIWSSTAATRSAASKDDTVTLSTFRIQQTQLAADLADLHAADFRVASEPRPYTVSFPRSERPFAWLAEAIRAERHPLLLADRKVATQLLAPLGLGDVPTFLVDAVEDEKDIATVLKVCDFLQDRRANRGSMLFVVGGGIVQDVGAFAGYMFKRGIPWTFVPTTLLSQGDSCVGGKTAVNHRKTKNLLGLFSAPRRVAIDTTFARTLGHDDRLSGGGEMYRLAITGGEASFAVFERHLDAFLEGSEEATRTLIACALRVKQQVVEADEFELDLRRSMNYGHSVGHAIEALSDYRIPHGIGVSVGILVENRIAVQRGLFPAAQDERLLRAGRRLVPPAIWKIVADLPMAGLLQLLASDKKAEGSVLKLATLKSIGEMVFIDLPLDASGVGEVEGAIRNVLGRVGA
jgi:3-dehydroquinate synthase